MSLFCPDCGTAMVEGEHFCANCGRDSSSASVNTPQNPQVAFGLAPETSGKAVFSLICGILSSFLPFAIAAVIFGHLSLSDVRRSAGGLKGKGLAIAGLFLGYAGVVFTAVLLILVVVSIPRAIRATRQAGDRSVVSAIRTLNTAEIAYAQAHPSSGYTCSLADLSGAWGIGTELAHGRRNGYVFVLQECTAQKPNGPIVRYQLVAYPMASGKGGMPAFCSNESAVIKTARNGSAQDCLTTGIDLSADQINRPQAWPGTVPK